MASAVRSLLLPALALLIALLALGHSALLYDESRQVEQRGLPAPVQAVENGKKIKRSGDHVTFRADITYAAPDGRIITAKAPISATALDAFHAGRPLQVRYLPDAPAVIRIAGEEYEGGSWLLVTLGAMALGYAAFGLLRLLRR
ncbi:DUF3592 domain-containing protein [Tahibacter harae]|uniref:DUF3592 domain-containing protein n=1 Tax=Tahibacter harae TaxID=2963937 RepID=A0ABT1QM04_9GAMM|nr:DUF3592 domain-containing protein [Tahibacter harae]MCQ4163561.1 DUF3592 domain-containing protein [Tahibacter harae]